jgi:hypothetical protein
MNLNERALLRGAIEAWRCSASLLRALYGKKENIRSPASRATLTLRKKLRVHSLGRDVSFTFAFCSTLEDR